MTNRLYFGLGLLCIALGLLGHVLAARAIGGTHLTDITLLLFGAVQALMGLFVYLVRFSMHG